MILPEHLLAVNSASSPVPSASGLIFASDLGGHPQIYLIDRPAAWPQRLAVSGDRMLPVATTPLGILARHDAGGNERWQLSLIDPQGAIRPVTRDAAAIHQSVTLSPDGMRVGMAYNPGGQVDFVLGVLSLATGEIQEWHAGHGYWLWEAWAPDGRQAVVSHWPGGTEVAAYLLEPKGKPRRLAPQARRLFDLSWTPGGRLFGLCNLETEMVGVVELAPESPQEPVGWMVQGDADVDAFVVDNAGRRAVVAVNRGLYDELKLIDLATGAELRRFDADGGVVSTDMTTKASRQIAWMPDDSSVFMSWETPTRPSDIFELDSLTRWTWAAREVPGLVTPRLDLYSSFDGLEIPSLWYRVDGRARPAVVYFHGGPESQIRGGYQRLFHLLNHAGIDVYAPNVRGSSGYGLTYQSLDDRALRWDSVRDGCEAARHLKATRQAMQVAAMGRSYGGFMTLAVLIEDPDLWDAAVEFVGIADWHSFFKNTSGWRREMRMAEYGDPEGAEAEALAEMSPLRRAATIKAPLLIVHGRNDVRVPVEESIQIAQATAEAELMILEDEGHGIVKAANQVRAYGRTLEFLVEKLCERQELPAP